MVQSTPTRLPLARWAQIANVNPLQFWGVAIEEVERPRAHTDEAWFQFGWQASDTISREELAEAIAQAEADIEEHLHYRTLPTWEAAEWRMTPRPTRPDMFNLNGAGVRGQSTTVEAEWGQFITGGVSRLTLVEAAASVAYASTRPPATYLDTATVTATVLAGTQPQEVRVFYPGEGGADQWEIRPLEVSIDAATNVATILFRRELAVVPDAFMTDEVNGLRPVDGTDGALFLATVDVYRRWNDPSEQAQLLWLEPRCSCGGDGCSRCTYLAQSGCLIAHSDPRLSVLGWMPAEWDADEEQFSARSLSGGRQPDLVRLWYYAGRQADVATPAVTMDQLWARNIAILAASRIRRAPVDMASRTFWDEWSVDLAYESGAEQISRFRTPQRLLNNPFGTRRGEVHVWQQIVGAERAIGQGGRLR